MITPSIFPNLIKINTKLNFLFLIITYYNFLNPHIIFIHPKYQIKFFICITIHIFSMLKINHDSVYQVYHKFIHNLIIVFTKTMIHTTMEYLFN